MTLAKAIILAVLAGIWILIALVGAVLSMPLWGMSYDQPLPMWFVAVGLGWIAVYCTLAIQIIRAKKLP